MIPPLVSQWLVELVTQPWSTGGFGFSNLRYLLAPNKSSPAMILLAKKIQELDRLSPTYNCLAAATTSLCRRHAHRRAPRAKKEADEGCVCERHASLLHRKPTARPLPSHHPSRGATTCDMFGVAALFCLLARALAQATTSASTTAATSPATSSTVSLWLPMGGIPERSIQASILFAVSRSPWHSQLAVSCATSDPARTVAE